MTSPRATPGPGGDALPELEPLQALWRGIITGLVLVMPAAILNNLLIDDGTIEPGHPATFVFWLLILLGGAAGVFVGPDQLDLPLTFEATRAAGATLGSGVIMVFDTSVDLVDTLRRIAQFFRDESCGQCVPCRVGSVRQEELLARLAAGSQVRTREEELWLLREIGQAMRDASICGLGQTASSAIESALRQPGMVAL